MIPRREIIHAARRGDVVGPPPDGFGRTAAVAAASCSRRRILFLLFFVVVFAHVERLTGHHDGMQGRQEGVQCPLDDLLRIVHGVVVVVISVVSVVVMVVAILVAARTLQQTLRRVIVIVFRFPPSSSAAPAIVGCGRIGDMTSLELSCQFGIEHSRRGRRRCGSTRMGVRRRHVCHGLGNAESVECRI